MITFGFYAEDAFAACEKEIIKVEFIEVFCGIFCNLLHFLAVFGIGEAEGFKVVALIYGIGDTAGNLQSPGFKEFYCRQKGFLINYQKIAMCLKTDLVDLYLLADEIPGILKLFQVSHVADLVNPGID